MAHTNHPEKVVRSVCLFTDQPSLASISRLGALAGSLSRRGFIVQTRRLCSPDADGIFELDRRGDGNTYLSVGRVGWMHALAMLDRMCAARNVTFNVEIGDQPLGRSQVEILLGIIQKNAAKTFNFSYTFNNALSSPFYPSAAYERNGFAIGLQPTDLSTGSATIDEWLLRLQGVWQEIDEIMSVEDDYLGVDTSIAPLFDGPGSFANLIDRIGVGFDRAVTTDSFLTIADFITRHHANRVGLCGLMFPCLEDFVLAREYERGNFSVERCLFLSLHCGLGLDAYPVGVDEDPERIVELLRLVQGLSSKYGKPLSVRLVSDGVAKIGDRTNFASPYLKDVVVRRL